MQIIVVGNEKGGTGKSTISMHIAVGLMRQSYSVTTIDTDARQGTLTRYIENRIQLHHGKVPVSDHKIVFNEPECGNKLTRYISECRSDFLIIDTPGSDTELSRLGHSYADILVTPMNDSFIDLDMLVRVDGSSMKIMRPSIYAETIWEQKKNKMIRQGRNIDWIVLRNRLSSIHSKNKAEIEKILVALSKRIGFRIGSGFSERVILRSLFLNGLTIADLDKSIISNNSSHISAIYELEQLLDCLKIRGVKAA